MAAMVMVIISSGIPANPIKPKIVPIGSKLATIATTATRKERKSSQNMTNSSAAMAPSVTICDS